MRKLKRFLPIITVVILLMSLSRALAKEIVQVMVSGPGLTVEVTDADTLSLFREMRFEGMLDSPPSDAGQTFYEIHLILGHEDQIIATDVYHYYPAPAGGYIFYADVINGWSTAEGEWFRLEQASDDALREFIAQQETTAARQPVNWLLPVWTLISALFG